MKEGVTFILAVILLLPPSCCGDAMCFIVKAKVLCFSFQMSTQLEISGWVIFTTQFQNSTMQIFECGQRILQRTVSWSWERVAYNVNTMNGCENYNVVQFQRRKDSLVILRSTFWYFKKLLLTIQTRVLSSVEECLFGVSMITNADMVLCLRDMTQLVKRPYESL